jgi:hypothetical protein
MRARSAFESSIKRAESLVDLHKNSFPAGRPPAKGEPPDILRAAVVFAVGAMDSYFHDKIIENVMRVIDNCASGGSGFPSNLMEVFKPKLTPEKTLMLLYRARPDEEIRKIISEHVAERTYQDPGRIEKGLQLIAIKDIWKSLRKELRLPSEKKAKEYVMPYIERRHQIVHEGDLYKSKKHRHRLRPISRPFAQKCVEEVRRYVFAIDAIVDDQMKRRECSG